MRLGPSLLMALAIVSLPARPAFPVIIETRNGQRAAGFLVREDDKSVVLRRLIDGEEIVQEYPKADVVMVLRPIDPRRLEALQPGSPKSYRDYAEELADKREDPEARETALRLYLIAAYLAPDELGRSGLIGMSALAETAEEERAYRAMAFLLDPKHDRNLLRPSSKVEPNRSDRTRRTFIAALQAYRTGQTTRAFDLARKPGVKAYFERTPGLMSHDAFLRSCQSHPECNKCGRDGRVACRNCRGKGVVAGNGFFNRPCPVCNGVGTVVCPVCQGRKSDIQLTDDQCKVFLRAEAELEDRAPVSKPSKDSQARESWAALLGRRLAGPVPELSLTGLTRFDPRECVYREGRWVKP